MLATLLPGFEKPMAIGVVMDGKLESATPVILEYLLEAIADCVRDADSSDAMQGEQRQSAV